MTDIWTQPDAVATVYPDSAGEPLQKGDAAAGNISAPPSACDRATIERIIAQNAPTLEYINQYIKYLEYRLTAVTSDRDMQEALRQQAQEVADMLRTELAAVDAERKDKERLDWLEQNPRYAQMMITNQVTECVFYGIACAELTPLREAIDAVRGK
jgi:small-conductance mechanosensitive channel